MEVSIQGWKWVWRIDLPRTRGSCPSNGTSRDQGSGSELYRPRNEPCPASPSPGCSSPCLQAALSHGHPGWTYHAMSESQAVVSSRTFGDTTWVRAQGRVKLETTPPPSSLFALGTGSLPSGGEWHPSCCICIYQCAGQAVFLTEKGQQGLTTCYPQCCS